MRSGFLPTQPALEMKHDFDYIIIGSGFGGSVSALRLSEKGYRVLVLEKGKWYHPADFPRTNWNLRRWLWVPVLRWFGIMKMTFFRHVTILSGVGVGGGSLVYANTLPRPKSAFFNSGSWKGLADWERELEPHYRTAERMLGASQTPLSGPADLALRTLASEIGRPADWKPTQTGVFYGPPGEEVPDPYFGGKGPARKGCIFCGACMTGCRHDAKNSLDKNYLHLAQLHGAIIKAEREVVDVKPLDEGDGSTGYEVSYRKSTAWFSSKNEKVTTRGVVFAGGVLGTVPLLLRLRKRSLPRLSERLGRDVRTNNESLLTVTSLQKDVDFSQGVAIGSILQTDENSHLEAVRYGKGSGFWRWSLLPLSEGSTLVHRLWNMLLAFLQSPLRFLRAWLVPDWARSTPILLFMQHLDSTLRLQLTALGRVDTRKDEGPAPTPFIPEATNLARRYAKIIDGVPRAFFLEPLAGIASTAHILGGAVMGSSPSTGVIDSQNRVFGYQNMYICDGSMISANPGVNPSLTITAITERAMSFIPKAKPDLTGRFDEIANDHFGHNEENERQ
ncbi:MAG: cholesterol oxidase [Saprospiraceae bacterium]|nr:MAG: cholesterol oxidase [Saprospiraceae bacterium]